jgi:hypothetical protein
MGGGRGGVRGEKWSQKCMIYEYMSYKSVIEGMNVVNTLDACMKEVQ